MGKPQRCKALNTPRAHYKKAHLEHCIVTTPLPSRRNGISPQLAALDEQVQNKLEWRYEMRREAQEILPGQF